MDYIVYNQDGKIMRTGVCNKDVLHLQAVNDDELTMEGTANDVIQKIINGKIVNKTPEEIEADNPTVPFEERPAFITNKQLQNVLDRISVLEKARH